MNNKTIIKTAIQNACSTVVYIATIASFLFYAPKIFEQNKPDTVLAPIVMLSLLVFSAALTGFLIFGRPVMWYLEGNKEDALKLFAYTLGVFFVTTLIALFVLFLVAS